MSKITKTERDELRRVVRQDFKVLAEEMTVRRAEMVAEIEQHVARRFAPSEAVLADAEAEIAQLYAEARKQTATVIERVKASCDGYDITAFGGDTVRLVAAPTKREEMRRALIADLDARIAQAKSQVHRQEADLLKTLATGALESDAAREFLASIPTVGELVPSARLAELEAQFARDDDQ